MKTLKWRKTNSCMWSLILGKGGRITIQSDWLDKKWRVRGFGDVWGESFDTVAPAMDFVREHFQAMVRPVLVKVQEKHHDLVEADRLFALHGIDRSAMEKEKP